MKSVEVLPEKVIVTDCPTASVPRLQPTSELAVTLQEPELLVRSKARLDVPPLLPGRVQITETKLLVDGSGPVLRTVMR